MNDSQILTIALASAPTMLTVLIGILINNSRFSDLNSRFGDLNSRFGDSNSRFGDLNSRFGDLNKRFDELQKHMDACFDDIRDTCRSELRRVEEVLDARLKHLEERSN